MSIVHKKERKILVVPSIRESCFRDFLAAWDFVDSAGDWDELILVEDNPERTFKFPGFDTKVDHHYSWKEITSTLGPDSWIISRRDSAIRSFGFLIAYRLGATHILTLDDDCFPWATNQPIFQTHIDQMENQPQWIPSVPGMRTRGLPYENLGLLSNVMVSMGLWTRHPDLDAQHSLKDPGLASGGKFSPPLGNRVIPRGQYIPFCSMNMAFKREITPLMYFPLMGLGHDYHRFDDIWCGIIIKKVMDHLGLSMVVGEPFVDHRKASNVHVNLIKEFPGMAVNEHYWKIFDQVDLKGENIISCYREMGQSLLGHPDGYIDQLGSAILRWVGLFEEDTRIGG